MNILNMVTHNASKSTQLGALVKGLEEQIGGGAVLPSGIGTSVFSSESMNDTVKNQVEDMLDNVSTIFDSLVAETGISVEGYQADMGKMGLLLGTNPTAHFSKNLPSVVTGVDKFSEGRGLSTESGYDERTPSYEAFDNSVSGVSTTYSYVYNAFASSQDDVGELWYPTVPVSPDEGGFAVTVDILRLGKTVQHSTSGARTEFKWTNALRAVADPSVLRNDLTKLVPVYRTSVNTDKFVDGTSAADYVAGMTVPMTTTVGDETVNTMPLLFGKEVSLLGLSQTDSLLAKGIMDERDTLDANMYLDTIMFGIDNAAGDAHAGFIYNVGGLPTANFYYTPQGSNQDMQLDFDNDAIIISAATLDAAGAPLGSQLTADTTYRLRVEVSAKTNRETSTTVAYGNRISLVSIMDANGDTFTSGSAFDAAAVEVSRISFLGYTVDVNRKNCNLRSMDQYIDNVGLSEVYKLRYRSSIIKKFCPTGMTDGNPEDLKNLINFTRIATMASAVDELQAAESALSGYVNITDSDNEPPQYLGMGRYLVKPYFKNIPLDMSTTVDSLTSADRAKDIQATLVNYMRDQAGLMVLNSEYKAPLQFSGVSTDKVTVIVVTDPTIHRYLTVDGDVRTLGDGVDVKIVSTPNVAVRGKIYMGLGIFDGTRNQTPNPLNSGNMGYAPEVTTVINVSSGGATHRMLAVTPRYLHVTHLPVMSVITVSNLPESLGKNVGYRKTVA